jgi:hypothetical protein
MDNEMRCGRLINEPPFGPKANNGGRCVGTPFQICLSTAASQQQQLHSTKLQSQHILRPRLSCDLSILGPLCYADTKAFSFGSIDRT